MGVARLFRSRWSALFWAAGIVWTAYDVADEAPRTAPGNTAAAATADANGAADLAIVANAADPGG